MTADQSVVRIDAAVHERLLTVDALPTGNTSDRDRSEAPLQAHPWLQTANPPTEWLKRGPPRAKKSESLQSVLGKGGSGTFSPVRTDGIC